MSRIVAGRFDRTLDADAVLQALRREGFRTEEIDSFYVDPPGQHSTTPIGGDVHSDAGARKAGMGAGIGAVVGLLLGLAVGVVGAAIDLGPPTIPLAALVGSLIGAFAGTMYRLRGGRLREASREHPVEPMGGRMIAVNVDRPNTESRAVALLRQYGARDVGRAEGDWRDGSWRDFDPRAPLATV
jgi:hypothetical protein